MKRSVILLLALAPLAAAADEGMWRPAQLPELSRELEALGMETDPHDLADLMGHPMNAVISLGGCTASFVSPDGLVVTNHHCAEGAIQYNSTEERNLLETGFLAADRAEELPAGPGSRVLVTVSVEDVTERVIGGIPAGAGGRERFEAIQSMEKQLVASCEQHEGHRCSVRSYHGGLEYELIKQLEIKDVRLVYAPARSIGVFGGDVDNWMWPRHTGDFSFYRAYVAPDGQPAEMADDNVPYRPRHYLKVSTSGVDDGELVLVAGYPGTTNRYRLSTEAANVIDWYYPTRLRLFGEWLQILEGAASDSDEIAIKYASLISGLNNATKNYQGMLSGFAKTDTVARGQKQEADLQAWIEADPERKERFLSALDELRVLIEEEQAAQEREMLYEYLARRGELVRTATTLYRLSRERQKPDLEREPGYQERDLEPLRERLTRIDRIFAAEVDRAFWRHFILRYASIPAEQHVEAFDSWFGIEGNEVDLERLDARLDEMYAATELDQLEKRLAWIEASPQELAASGDPFIRLAGALYDSDLELEAAVKDREGRMGEARRRYTEAMIAFLESQGRAVYPDANGTLRVTYGAVHGYRPRDAVRYQPFTTLTGILEKQTGDPPFDAPAEQIAAIRERRFGRFADDRLGSVAVNFLSTVDTTGGNSGSATLNADGELVGLLFDGNWESIIADWDFNPDLTRSIHVDMRYVLWVMEELDGAHHLLREMGAAP